MREIDCYYLDNCYYSSNAKLILENIETKTKINFYLVEPNKKELIKEKYKNYLGDHKTFPMIFIKNNEKVKFFGGFSELKKFIEKVNKNENLSYLEYKLNKYLYKNNI